MNKDNLSYVFSVVFCVFVVSYLFSFFLDYINICDQKVQNSLSYEAFLPITWIKPSTGVTKYDASDGGPVFHPPDPRPTGTNIPDFFAWRTVNNNIFSEF